MQKHEILQMSLSELYDKLKTSEQGLSDEEAEKRLAIYGRNILRKKHVRAINVFAGQFKNSLSYLLLAASIIAYGVKDYSDGTIILIILVINASLGFYQEYKSEKIIEKLSRILDKQVRTKRNEQITLLPESQIVPGDIIILREGDIVPADIRLLQCENLRVNESQITGESVPIIKHVIAEKNATDETLLFTGSTIEKGEGTGVVYATGDYTELGAVAKLSTKTKKQTQYEKSMRSFSAFLVRIVLVGLVFVFFAKLFFAAGRQNTTSLLLFIIALAVAAVPEALPVIATVTLSNEALKLAKQHVIVKRLSAIEDLGNVNLLCTDKTGTLTENTMTIKKITSPDEKLFQTFACIGIAPPAKNNLARNSYDDAFSRYIPKEIQNTVHTFRIIKELPFDPDDRRSRIIVEDSIQKKIFFVSIGAPEALLSISRKNQRESEVDHLQDISREGKNGLMHLAISYKELPRLDGIDVSKIDILKNEQDLIFLGYASLEDPLRPTAQNAINHAERLGIKIKILTGDSKEVAEYIGKQTGLIKEGDTTYTGSELNNMSPDEFTRAVMESNVFARLTPEQKFNIIGALKKNYVVAYQGDGINDAPALKLADVAIAVNSAIDIAKESADIVLLNKSLETIVNGIKYGRTTFVNINKYIKYAMSNNFGAFIGLSVLYLFSLNLPILPVQMLLNNLIGDIPLIMVSTDSVENNEIVRPEKHNVKELILTSLILGMPTALFEIFYFLLIKTHSTAVVQTSLYVFFTFQALIIFYSIRSKNHFWRAKMPSAILNISFLLSFACSLAIIYIRPFQAWFSFVPLSTASIEIIFTLMTIYFIAIDYVKVSIDVSKLNFDN